MQLLADAADLADDVHQVADRRGTLPIFDVGRAALASLDAVDPVFNVVLGLRLLVGARVLRRLDEFLGEAHAYRVPRLAAVVAVPRSQERARSGDAGLLLLHSPQ